MIQKFRIILAWVAVGLLLLFGILNRTPVTVDFWFLTQVRAPLAIIVLGSAGMGALAVYMFKAYRNAKAKEK